MMVRSRYSSSALLGLWISLVWSSLAMTPWVAFPDVAPMEPCLCDMACICVSVGLYAIMWCMMWLIYASICFWGVQNLLICYCPTLVFESPLVWFLQAKIFEKYSETNFWIDLYLFRFKMSPVVNHHPPLSVEARTLENLSNTLKSSL